MIQKNIIISALLSSIAWTQFETPVTITLSQKKDVRPGEVATIIVNLQMDDELEFPRELKIEHLSPIDRSSPPVVHNKMKGKPSLNNNKKNVSTPATTKIIKLEQEIIDLDKKLEKYKHLNH